MTKNGPKNSKRAPMVGKTSLAAPLLPGFDADSVIRDIDEYVEERIRNGKAATVSSGLTVDALSASQSDAWARQTQ